MDKYDYWKERVQREAAKAYNSQEKRTAAYLKAYRDVYDQLEKETAALYARYAVRERLMLSDLYKYQRYVTYMKQVKTICEDLAKKEKAFSDKSYKRLYQEAYLKIGKIGEVEFDKIPKKTIETLLDTPWSGENYSQRIWANRDVLIRNVRQTVIRGSVKGSSLSDMTGELLDRVESSAFNARRLIRTESMHFINQGQLDGYRKLGIEKVEILVAEDERTCEECMQNEGRVLPIEEADFVLPVHPMCRCTFVPVEKSLGKLRNYMGDKS